MRIDILSNELNISKATIRNWLKLGVISQKDISENNIEKIKISILSISTEKLSKRANKTNSKRTFSPTEYFTDKSNITLIKNYLELLNSLEFNNIEEKIFISTILFLKQLSFFDAQNSFSEIFQFLEKKHEKYIYNELSDWRIKTTIKYNRNFEKLINFGLPENENDILGIIYQSLKKEGEKSNSGSYYTPQSLVQDIVNKQIKSNYKILDPACGTGQFLLNFTEKIKNPQLIFGFDIDKNAVRIARINLMLKYKHLNFRPNIFLRDFIFNNQQLTEFTDFDFIATNPPWGAKFSTSEKKNLQKINPIIKSGEIFSHFLFNSLNLLKKNGVMSFILPSSVLNVKIHKDIRQYLNKNSTILKIYEYGKIFDNVFTDVIRIDIKKSHPNKNKVEIFIKNKNYYIEQSEFSNNDNNIFYTKINEEELKIIKKIYNCKHFYLKNNAKFGLGIVTGNNKKLLLNKKTAISEPIYKGSDIDKFFLKKSTSYIEHKPSEYQQIAPEEIYRTNEKLIYKFISKNLIFAYDNSKSLTLNSANILIPKVKGYNIKIFVAFLNSKLYNFIFQKKYNSIKILRSHIENLPIPYLSDNQKTTIIKIVDKILKTKIISSDLDNYICDLFNLTDSEKNIVLNSYS